MMAVPIFTGWIEKGDVVRFDNPSFVSRYLNTLDGKNVEIIIRKERHERSLRQNSYYWGVVIDLIAQHCGYEPDELHEALKIKFLSDPKMDEHGLLRVRSTTTLNTEEFNDYLNRIVRWAAQELQVYVPDPAHVHE